MSTLVIFDEDEEYVHSLMEYIGDKKGLPFNIEAFSDFDRYEKYMKERGADILLISPDALQSLDSNAKVNKTIIFSDGDAVSEMDDIACIYKYQSVDNILGEVLDYYSQSGISKGYLALGRGKTTEIIGVYSPVGRSQKTSFAMTLGHVLAEDKETLYMYFEDFSGLSSVVNREFRQDLSDLMYHYRMSPDSIGVKLKAIACNIHGLDVIPPMNYSIDLRNIGSSLWRQLIEDIASTGIYEVVVVDLSNMVGDVFEVLSVCNTIYMPVRQDRISMSKINELEQYLFKSGREELIAKTVKIQPPIKEETGWDEDYMEQLMWGEFGDFVRKLVKDNVA